MSGRQARKARRSQRAVKPTTSPKYFAVGALLRISGANDDPSRFVITSRHPTFGYWLAELTDPNNPFQLSVRAAHRLLSNT